MIAAARRLPRQGRAPLTIRPSRRRKKLLHFFPRCAILNPPRGCSSSVELRLPKPIRWVRLPSSAPKRKARRQAGFSFWHPGGSRTGAVSENVPGARFPRDQACPAGQVDSHHPLQKRGRRKASFLIYLCLFSQNCHATRAILFHGARTRGRPRRARS